MRDSYSSEDLIGVLDCPEPTVFREVEHTELPRHDAMCFSVRVTYCDSTVLLTPCDIHVRLMLKLMLEWDHLRMFSVEGFLDPRGINSRLII